MRFWDLKGWENEWMFVAAVPKIPVLQDQKEDNKEPPLTTYPFRRLEDRPP